MTTLLNGAGVGLLIGAAINAFYIEWPRAAGFALLAIAAIVAEEYWRNYDRQD